MLKNFDFNLKNIDGTDIKENDKEVAARTIIVNAVLGTFTQERDGISGEEKAKRYSLATRLNKGGDQEVEPEEIVLIKTLLGYGWPPLVVGQIFEYINK